MSYRIGKNNERNRQNRARQVQLLATILVDTRTRVGTIVKSRDGHSKYRVGDHGELRRIPNEPMLKRSE